MATPRKQLIGAYHSSAACNVPPEEAATAAGSALGGELCAHLPALRQTLIDHMVAEIAADVRRGVPPAIAHRNAGIAHLPTEGRALVRGYIARHRMQRRSRTAIANDPGRSDLPLVREATP